MADNVSIEHVDIASTYWKEAAYDAREQLESARIRVLQLERALELFERKMKENADVPIKMNR